MTDLRFDGKVAIVTGGGRGLGRSHATLLAGRGAKVVINDLGSHGFGYGSSADRASEAVAEIRAAGGDAVAHFGDVSSEDDTRALIDLALDRYGRIDIVVNNAGINRFIPFAEMTREQFESMLRVHVLGSFLVTRAAWPHFVKQGYGRVVMTSSTGMMGLEHHAHYSAAKGGVVGLVKALGIEGRPAGITVNGIFPQAATPLFVDCLSEEDRMPESLRDLPSQLAGADASPELVSPVVGWLAHEDCPTSGEMFSVGFGWVGRVSICQNAGFADAKLSMESVREQWSTVCADGPQSVITNTIDALLGQYTGAKAGSEARG